jgi:hypothetical protein
MDAFLELIHHKIADSRGFSNRRYRANGQGLFNLNLQSQFIAQFSTAGSGLERKIDDVK